MIIETPGRISERIIMLGRRESCVYLIDGGTESAVLGGGMLTIVPDVIRQLDELNIQEERIRRMVILHSHFDHCGAIPWFKTRWPEAVVTASIRASELLARQKVIQSINFMNQMALEKYGLAEKTRQLGLSFPGIRVEEEIKDGDTLVCGELSMQIIGVPGHSSCSIAVYLPDLNAMFVSDSAGVPFGTGVLTAANSDFDQYRESLSRLAGYDIDALFLEHFGARTGRDARRFMDKSMESADKTRTLLEESLRQTGDIKKSKAQITRRLMDDAPESALAEEIVALVVEMMLRSLQKKAGIKTTPNH